ncbi:MAG: 4-(cytidine 5'-diphospho)-2-C-methyl-D-erythritol kinase, partial [Halanaerobiaceae bacterium]
DGFHEVEMILQSIDLYDLIEIKKRDNGINLSTTSADLPDDEGNIAYRAAELIINEARVNGGVQIHIKKKIPIAAGLAGGSTDAAAVLKAVNHLYDINFNYDYLLELAAGLGSDVPFCLQGGTALARGRGEKIEQLPDIKKTEMVIITPPVKVSTARIYKKYDSILPGKEISVRLLSNSLKENSNIRWHLGWGNILENITGGFIEDIYEIKKQLRKMGVIFEMMSGSGPSVFGIVKNHEQGQYIKDNWPRKKDFIETARTIKKGFPELSRI